MRARPIPFAREACMEAAKFCYAYHLRGHSYGERLSWVWLLRWAGARI